MYRGSGPKIVPLIIAVLVVALIIAALVSVGRMLFTGGGSGDSAAPTEDSGTLRDAVVNTGDARAVRLTVRGPIVADENFRSYQITVAPAFRTYTLYSGYLDQVVDERTFTNNKQAYEEFVYALDKAAIGKTRDADDADFRGVCATQGIAFKFDALNDNDVKQSAWTSTCKGSKGTMGSNIAQIHALFGNQIPNFKAQFNKIY